MAEPVYDSYSRSERKLALETEHTRAEESLQRSEERFRLLAANAKDMIYRFRVAEPRGFEYISPGCHDVFGYTQEEFYAEPGMALKIVHPEDRRRFGDHTAPWDVESGTLNVRGLRKDGTAIWVEMRRTPIYDDSGKLLAVEGISRDVTERKITEEALRESAERFKLLAEHATDMIYRLRWLPSKQYEYVSPAATQMTGYPPEEWYANPGLGRDIVHPEDRRIVDDELIGTGFGEQPQLLRWIRRDGRVIWVENEWVAIRNDAGSVIATQGIARDVTRWVEQQESLRQSEERFRRLAQNAADIVYYFRLTPTPSLEYISPAAEAILGYTPAEFLGYPNLLTDIIHPDDRPLMDTLLQNEDHTDQPISLRVLPKHGGMKWIELSRSVVHDDSGQPVAIQGIVRDVTQRVQQEEALRQSEERFRLLAENAKDWIFRFNVTEPSGVVYSSPACQTITGYTPEEFCADNELGFRIVHPDDRPMVETLPDVRERFAEPLRYRLRTKDGDWIHVESLRTPVYNDDGNIVAIEGTTRDVTERRTAEEALRQSEERFRLLAENASDWIFRFSMSEPRGLVYSSPAGQMITGYTPDELRADNELVFEIVHPDDRRQIETLPDNPEGFAEPLQYRLKTKDGDWKSLEARRTPIYDGEGILVAVEGIVRDMTEQRRAEQALRKLAVVEERTRLAGEIHDTLAQSLVGIVIRLKTARDDLKIEPSSVEATIESTLRLAQDTLQEARRSVWELRPRVLASGSLAQAVRDEVSKTRAEGVPISLDVQGEASQSIDNNSEVTVLRIVQEALTNVRRHAHARKAEVQLTFGDAEIVLRVADDGLGFDLSGYEQRSESDRGFGLTIMHERARLRGGRIEIRSTPGIGTELQAWIPNTADGEITA